MISSRTTVPQSSSHDSTMIDSSNSSLPSGKFIPPATQIYDELLHCNTIGLIPADTYKTNKQQIDRIKDNTLKSIAIPNSTNHKSLSPPVKKKQKIKLSFVDDKDDDNHKHGQYTVTDSNNDHKLTATTVANAKNPSIDTTHLPDSGRDAQLELMKQQLQHEWLVKQSELKQSKLTILYSYYDGTSHRHTQQIQYSDTIQLYLHLVKNSIKHKYHELTYKNTELLFIKNDTILPSNLTFYDLITNQLNEHTRLLSDFSDTAYPPKVMTQQYYDRHKHVYPYKNYVKYEDILNKELIK